MESIGSNSESMVFAQRDANNQGVAKEKSLNLLMGNLTEAAAMAYGSGIGENIKGGAGHIGVLNGKVVKFNTKFAERRALDKGSETYGEMMKTCDNLRNRLASNLTQVGLLFKGSLSNFQATDGQLLALKTELSKLLGLKLVDGRLVKAEGQGMAPNGALHYQLTENRGLLTREAVAKSVTLIRDFLKDHVKTGETAADAPSVLVRDDASGERADFDFHIWSKVKAMKGLSSQAIPIDSFTYSKQVAAAVKEVVRFKAGGWNVRPFLELQKVGNEKMKEAIGPIWRRECPQSFDKVTLHLHGGEHGEISPVTHKRAAEIVNAYRVQAMAEAMDAMLVKLHDLYARQHKGAGASAQATPFKDLFLRSFAKLRGKSVEEIAALTPEKRFLSLNELRNLKAMMRNELLAFVMNQGNEFEPAETGVAPKISVKVMLEKDFYVSCARLLDIDGEAGDHSYVVGMPVPDRSGRIFRESDKGKTVFGEGDYNIFTDETYGVLGDDDILNEIGRESKIKELKDAATANVLNELFDKPHTVQPHGAEEPVTIKLAPERFRDLAKGYVQSALKELEKPGSRNPQTIGRLREDFVRKVLVFDAGINVDVRRYVLDENEGRGVSAREMMQKLVGDIFDQHLANIAWPEAI